MNQENPNLVEEKKSFLESLNIPNTNAEESASKSSSKILKEFVFFSSEKCGFCRKFQPVWDKIQEEYPMAAFRKVSVQESRSESDKYQVTGYPTIIYIVDGIATSYSVGYKEESIFSEFVKETLRGNYTSKPERNKPQPQQQFFDLDAYTIKCSLEEWSSVYKTLYKKNSTMPVQGFFYEK
jgi:thiol-disulfide isomerase/thioredoxin